MAKFEIGKDSFFLDGKPLRVLSGAMHYFRTLPEYWEDRLIKIKQVGLNTVETYVPWNLHEPREGEFNFEGLCDIERFIQIAEKVGLYVIVRPSP
ncbi:MAG TPA: beta-galactosidase, partial [Clostridiales bacterium]|nr:beta-galactosidase [Clostridiales bacterium]